MRVSRWVQVGVASFALFCGSALVATDAGAPAWLSLDDTSGLGRVTVRIHSDGGEIGGWSFALCYEAADVQTFKYRWSDALLAEFGDELPEGFLLEEREDGARAGVAQRVQVDPAQAVNIAGVVADAEEGFPVLEILHSVVRATPLSLCEDLPDGEGEAMPFEIMLDGAPYLPQTPASVTLPRPQVRLSPPESHDRVSVSIHGAAIQGWSLNVCHDADAADIVGFGRTPELATIRSGFPPSFMITELADDPETGRSGVIQAVALDFYDELTAPVSPAGFEVLEIEYAVHEEAEVEVCQGLSGSGEPIHLALTVRGATNRPEPSRALLRPKPYRNNFAFRVEPPESGDVVNVMLYSDDLPAEGWSFALCHTAQNASIVEWSNSPELEQLVNGEPPEFLSTEITPADPFVAIRQTVVLGLAADPVVAVGPFEDGLPLMGIRYDVAAEDRLKFCDTVGDIRFTNEVSFEGVGYVPATRTGAILVLGDLGTKFIRGDANLDRGLTLTDAVFIFTTLFLGGATLPCYDAANVNDVGRVDVSDPIFLLNYLFLGGLPPPPPFPEPGSTLNPHSSLGCERGI